MLHGHTVQISLADLHGYPRCGDVCYVSAFERDRSIKLRPVRPKRRYGVTILKLGCCDCGQRAKAGGPQLDPKEPRSKTALPKRVAGLLNSDLLIQVNNI